VGVASGPEKFALIIIAITLSTLNQFSKYIGTLEICTQLAHLTRFT